ncbi:cheC-like family protein [Paraburkholderia xenovorans LB400]|jgi:chemotaxis protein CheC|uniref:CheC, inhibitor of MCP methylation n=2 Tax=Paraburkholderia TaxID=1822464 RepID=Q13J23_PARXL|nr:MULTISPECIES: chemotaxis protein CheC [Paraburkholderia]EIF35414.1 chemotaxis protein CheC, inhibitor of MCP methylation [Burkholderia sp. Ch1-1]ABE35916.1 CheC, inhibitor of MCP methylation [Paraburkholderia xenovorans LB400]AIP37612.1 cheC-like family protein [Paraburkholderia xenovorans LB400]MDR8397295.1 chemotaxis protein CheC [Paraburkholderia sp. USG1]NPT37177.1 chemotaxis protein [Paraburkholderia xenovorans]
MSEPVLTEDQRDALQEVANLAMGQAATRLARLLDAFIELSVPRVKVVAVSEAAQALREMTGIEDTVSAVRQGFRSDIKGEALVICRSDSIEQLCSLVSDPYSRSTYETVSQKELVFDVANVLTGACVSCILDQLGRTPIFSAPGLLGEAMTLDAVFQPGVLQWEVALLVEVNFALEDQSFRAHLVMLMAEESIRHMNGALDALLSSL